MAGRLEQQQLIGEMKMSRSENVDNLLTEVRKDFTCADYPNYGSDDAPTDGLLTVWVSGMDMFTRKPHELVAVLKSGLPAGSKFLGDFYHAYRDGVALRFAHPDLPKLGNLLDQIKELSLWQLQTRQ
jgi:hypothetical protein